MKRRLAAFIASLALLTTCRANDGAPALRATVIIASPESAEVGTISAGFEDWIARAVRDPGASYAVYATGSDRGGARVVFAAVVPASWSGGDALATKAHWIQTTRADFARAAATRFTSAVPTMLPESEIGSVDIFPPRDSRSEAWTFRARGRRHESLVCDRSKSAEAECSMAVLVRDYDRWLAEAASPGSSFEVWRVGTSLSTARRIFSVETPKRLRCDQIVFLLGARRELETLLPADSCAACGSAIAETIALAIESLGEKSAGALHLRIASDGRQLSTFDFQGRGVPHPATFVAWLKGNRLAPQCADIDVDMCGLHNRATHPGRPLSPRDFAAIRDAWSAAFAALHARSFTVCGACDTGIARRN